MNQLRFLV